MALQRYYSCDLPLNDDSLPSAQNDNLQIHEEKSKGVYVKGLSDFYVGDQADVYNIMKQGSMARAVSSTSECFYILQRNDKH